MRLKSNFTSRIFYFFLFSFVFVGCKFNKEIEPLQPKTSRLDSLFNAAEINEEIPGAVVTTSSPPG